MFENSRVAVCLDGKAEPRDSEPEGKVPRLQCRQHDTGDKQQRIAGRRVLRLVRENETPFGLAQLGGPSR